MGRSMGRMAVLLLCCTMLCMIPAGCGQSPEAESTKGAAAMTTTGRSAETDMEAMVVRLHDGSLLLVDNRSGSPFVPTAIDEADRAIRDNIRVLKPSRSSKRVPPRMPRNTPI